MAAWHVYIVDRRRAVSRAIAEMSAGPLEACARAARAFFNMALLA